MKFDQSCFKKCTGDTLYSTALYISATVSYIKSTAADRFRFLGCFLSKRDEQTNKQRAIKEKSLWI